MLTTPSKLTKTSTTKSELTSNPRVVVSMSALLGYGLNLDTKELHKIQRMMNHSDFKQYRYDGITQLELTSKLTDKFPKLSPMLLSIITSCKLNRHLIRKYHRNNIIIWQDIPTPELKRLFQIQPKLKLQFKRLRLPRVNNLDTISIRHLIIVFSVELATQLLASGRLAIPIQFEDLVPYESEGNQLNYHGIIPNWIPSTSDSTIISSNNKLITRETIESNLVDCKLELNKYQSELNLNSIVIFKNQIVTHHDKFDLMEKGTLQRNGLIKEYFNPTLAAQTGSFQLPDTWIHSLIDLVKSGPFGYLGTDFDRLPADVDTMALNIGYLYQNKLITKSTAMEAFTRILGNFDGTSILVYLDEERPRFDPVVLCNVLNLSYLLNYRDTTIETCHNLIINFFLTGGYQFGTHYYQHPDTFLCHFGNLLLAYPTRFPPSLLSLFRKIIQTRIGLTPVTPLCLSQRILISQKLHLSTQPDLQLLIAMNQNHRWPHSNLYLVPTSDGYIVNPVVDLSFIQLALSSSLRDL